MNSRRSQADWLASLDAVLRLPISEEARSTRIRQLIAEAETARWTRSYEPPNYDHLPSLQELKLHVGEPANGEDTPGLKRAWDAARDQVREAYELLGANVAWLTSLTVDPRDTYLVSKVVPDYSDSDRFRYAAGSLDALRRAEKFPRNQRTERVTPGYRWTIYRLNESGHREAVKVTLSLNAKGVAQLRCGDTLTAATAPDWAEATARALPQPAAESAPPPAWPHVLLSVVGMLRFLISWDFWVGILMLALVVTIGVIIVMALF